MRLPRPSIDHDLYLAALGLSAGVAAALIALSVYAFILPKSETETQTLATYAQTGRFGYTVLTAPDALGTAVTIGPVRAAPNSQSPEASPVTFPADGSVLEFTYTYQLQGASGISGSIAADLEIKTEDGSSRTMPLVPATPFRGATGAITGSINLTDAISLFNQLKAETGIDNEAVEFVIAPIVDVEATVGGHEISENYSSPLSLAYSANQLTPDTTLAFSDRGAITEDLQFDKEMGLFGSPISVGSFRSIGTPTTLIAVALTTLLAVVGLRGIGRTAAVASPSLERSLLVYRSRLLGAVTHRIASASVHDSATFAGIQGQSVFVRDFDNGARAYVVNDGEAGYLYAIGDVPVGWTSVVGAVREAVANLSSSGDSVLQISGITGQTATDPVEPVPARTIESFEAVDEPLPPAIYHPGLATASDRDAVVDETPDFREVDWEPEIKIPDWLRAGFDSDRLDEATPPATDEAVNTMVAEATTTVSISGPEVGLFESSAGDVEAELWVDLEPELDIERVERAAERAAKSESTAAEDSAGGEDAIPGEEITPEDSAFVGLAGSSERMPRNDETVVPNTVSTETELTIQEPSTDSVQKMDDLEPEGSSPLPASSPSEPPHQASLHGPAPPPDSKRGRGALPSRARDSRSQRSIHRWLKKRSSAPLHEKQQIEERVNRISQESAEARDDFQSRTSEETRVIEKRLSIPEASPIHNNDPMQETTLPATDDEVNDDGYRPDANHTGILDTGYAEDIATSTRDEESAKDEESVHLEAKSNEQSELATADGKQISHPATEEEDLVRQPELSEELAATSTYAASSNGGPAPGLPSEGSAQIGARQRGAEKVPLEQEVLKQVRKWLREYLE